MLRILARTMCGQQKESLLTDGLYPEVNFNKSYPFGDLGTWWSLFGGGLSRRSSLFQTVVKHLFHAYCTHILVIPGSD